MAWLIHSIRLEESTLLLPFLRVPILANFSEFGKIANNSIR